MDVKASTNTQAVKGVAILSRQQMFGARFIVPNFDRTKKGVY